MNELSAFAPSRVRLPSVSALILCIAVLAATRAVHAQPRHVYLTWQGDTSRTMTINFQTLGASGESLVRYDTESRKGEPEAYRRSATGASHKIAGLADGRSIHVVELTGLKPGRTYYFVAGDPGGGFSKERTFRTVPDGRFDTLRFVTGGDMGVGPQANQLLRRAGRRDPDFAIIGGDLAYVNGRLDGFATWDKWFDAWDQYMVAPDGRMIPMVLAIGNHEVEGGYDGSPEKAPFYLGYFAQGGRTYFSRRFGKHTTFFILDSGHIVDHRGPQAEWLASEMKRNRKSRYKFAIYHIPLYPSHRVYWDFHSFMGRKHWRPSFDKYELTAAFENHDHVHKRTHPMRGGKIDPAGTVYFGDGTFGRGARTVKTQRKWYEAVATPTPHFWLVEVNLRGATYRAIDRRGHIFDIYPEAPNVVAPTGD